MRDSLVFPACAGMFLKIHGRCTSNSRFPRVRGDVPPLFEVKMDCGVFSPRARGCSLVLSLVNRLLGVFPACAGMFLANIRNSYIHLRFPRVRGDVPHHID